MSQILSKDKSDALIGEKPYLVYYINLIVWHDITFKPKIEIL